MDEDTEVVKQIKELIDQRVRPAVAMDGGDISFCSFEDGVVTLQNERCLRWMPIKYSYFENGNRKYVETLYTRGCRS